MTDQISNGVIIYRQTLSELERVEHRFVPRLTDTAEATVSTAVRVLVVDEDGYLLHDRPLERKSPTNPRREGWEQCNKYYTS